MTTSSKQQQVKFKGLSMYASVLPGQARSAHPDSIAEGNAHVDDSSYSIQVECSRNLFEKLEDMKLPPAQKLKKYEDQPGKTYINVKGTHTKMWTDPKTGESSLLTFPDPILQDADGNKWSGGEIGNGSVVEVVANINKNKRGMSLRLHSVKVLDHVPYESKAKEGEVILESDSGVTKAQPPVADSATNAKAAATEGFF